MVDVARSIVDRHLLGLDDEILAYISDMVQGDESEREMTEAIAAFLVSCETAESSEAAVGACEGLFAALRAEGIGRPSGAEAEEDSSAKLLNMKTSLKGDDARLFRDEDDSGLGGRLVDISEALDDRKKRKAKLEAERRATKAQYTRIMAQRAAEEEALQNAMQQSVALRRKLGAYTGAVEAKPFMLPNPGGGRDLLEGASFTLVRGRIYGLIGRNGKGKSTLLKAVASRAVGDIPPELTVHYVSQELQLSEESQEWTPAQLVVHADVERRLLLEEAAALGGGDEDGMDAASALRLDEVQTRLEAIEADSATERATALLKNLGFPDELRGRKMKALSGGWRVRTALAAAIFAKPDLLLLDEPTNHLSIGAVLWLARELSTNETWQQRIVIIVSHDRVFLDEVSTDTLHVSGAARKLTQSRGNYSAWAKRREQQQLTFSRAMETKLREIKDLRDFNPATLGSTPKAMRIYKTKSKQAEKLEEEAEGMKHEAAALQEDAELPLSLKAGGELNGFVVNIKEVSFGYDPNRPLFQNVELGVDTKSRIVLLGENGNGKTTLVKLLLGDLEPTVGEGERETPCLQPTHVTTHVHTPPTYSPHPRAHPTQATTLQTHTGSTPHTPSTPPPRVDP